VEIRRVPAPRCDLWRAQDRYSLESMAPRAKYLPPLA